uniref:Apoptosis inhibitor 5 n=1 Tax=Amphimedon queenslandica TaxID=400682 RepID=A0A1X7SWQ5_AMPQE
MAGDGVEALYRNYGILADAGDKAGEQTEAFLGLLESAKGSAAVKRLVSGFIAKFARFFPTLEGDIMNVLFDLVEDDESLVRQAAIKSLPELCKNNKSNKDLCTKVADVLTQLLVSDDPADVILVKSAMSTILIHDTPSALIGIFDQILGEDETLREKAIEYVSVPLMDMRHVLFIPKEENEKCLLELVKKVLGDVTAAEFETFVDVLGKLHHLQSPEGANVIIDVIAEQAELDGNFQSEGPEAIDRFITCFRLALKYCKNQLKLAKQQKNIQECSSFLLYYLFPSSSLQKGGSSYQFVRYASVEILPSFASITDAQKQQN